MPREISRITKKEFNDYLKKEGMTLQKYINYRPKRKSKDAGQDVMHTLNDISESLDGVYKIVLQGIDENNNYLYRIIEK